MSDNIEQYGHCNECYNIFPIKSLFEVVILRMRTLQTLSECKNWDETEYIYLCAECKKKIDSR